MDFIKSLHESSVAKKDAPVILKSHIRNLSFNDTWTMVLDSLPAGSPNDSLQTVSTNISNLEKKPEELTLKVTNNTGQLFKTMDMVADMKSKEVACRQDMIEHQVRLHNLNQLGNFRELNFRDILDLVFNTLSKIHGTNENSHERQQSASIQI